MTNYRIDEADMNVDIPSEYITFTRDVEEDDPNLTVYGFTKDSLLAIMDYGNMYLNAWDVDISFQLMITAENDFSGDFNSLTEEEFNQIETSLENDYKDYGITLIKAVPYQHNQARFLKVYLEKFDGSDTVYELEYYTVYGNKAVGISIESYNGEIDDKQEEIVRQVVDSVVFGSDPDYGKSNDSGMRFTDNKTGITFTVPANWEKTELVLKRETVDTAYKSLNEDDLVIYYISTDLWDKLSDDEKEDTDRSEMNNIMFSGEDTLKKLNGKTGTLKIVEYGGKEYYQFETEEAAAHTEDPDNVTTNLVRYANGYMYQFAYTDSEDSWYFNDFETMIEGVKYPAEATPEEALGEYTEDFTLKEKIISIIIAIVIYTIPILIYRFIIHRKPVDKKKGILIGMVYAVITFFILPVLLVILEATYLVEIAVLAWTIVNIIILTH